MVHHTDDREINLTSVIFYDKYNPRGYWDATWALGTEELECGLWWWRSWSVGCGGGRVGVWAVVVVVEWECGSFLIIPDKTTPALKYLYF